MLSEIGELVGTGVGEGVTEGVFDGVTDADAEAEIVGFAVVDVLPAAWLLLVGDVQPLIDTRTRDPIKSNGNAYLSGVLMYRFIIRVIGFILHPLEIKQIRKAGSMKLKNCYLCRGGD